MKRNVLCFFSFILILLVFFTCVSTKVEEEMNTLVEARHGTGTKYQAKRNIVIGSSAITWENSDDILFNIIEGDGWESGLRIAEIPSTYYDRYESHVELGSGTDYWYIFSASREPVSGSAITIVEETRKGNDIYLIWHPEEITNLEKLPNSMEVLHQLDNAALISMRSATFPFFEHRVWYTLQKYMDPGIRVYSLHDVQVFLEALPWISAIMLVLLCSFILCSGSWLLLDKAGRNNGILWLNILLITGLLASLPRILNQFDLPASLMPKEFILDIPHYTSTFERILTSLDSMGSQIVKNAFDQAISASGMVLGIGILTTVMILLLETLICLCGRKKE